MFQKHERRLPAGSRPRSHVGAVVGGVVVTHGYASRLRLSLLPGLEQQHGAKHDQGNDQDDDEFAKAKHDLVHLFATESARGAGVRRTSSAAQLRACGRLLVRAASSCVGPSDLLRNHTATDTREVVGQPVGYERGPRQRGGSSYLPTRTHPGGRTKAIDPPDIRLHRPLLSHPRASVGMKADFFIS